MTKLTSDDREVAARAGANPLRSIPPIAELCAAVRAHGIAIAEPLLTNLVRREVEEIRTEIRDGALHGRDDITERVVAAALALQRPRLGRVINATGIIVHTNLGRAPVSRATAQAMALAAASAVPLEIDPATNRRGGRMREITALLQVLTGAGAALVVNNCAAAVLLALSALASGREVIVSRGEAIEIGG
ncbi:MAG: L-seryl-tRNA(Sec) selenium transferase, partial [Chloroflexota bacterium]|nr:L-seryl-tRNA(Sec) selenium transferase [Chloroflexota bacterium]